MQQTAAGVSTGTDAAAANEWRRVGRAGRRAGTQPEPGHGPAVAAAANDPRLLGVRFAPAGTNDGRYRAAYESTIALRNRLFGN